ncbi:DNA polymerase III subunit beta [Pelagibacteraceae bacterium]|nr:DNA polymerase III subunit beta [Pelagibacteraceae bacterium]
MKFKIKRSIFFKTLSHLQGIVDKKNSLPILANILIEAKNNQLVLSCTDMDISVIEKIGCTVLEDGATTINSQILYDIVRKIDDRSEIEIISNNGKLLTLRSDGSRFSLACLPREDYPIIDQENSGISIKLNSKILFKLIDKTKFAISNEETRYFLNGLYFNVSNETNKNIVTLVGTDGHRLAKFSHEIDEDIDQISGVIIPKKTIYELSKLLSEIDKNISISISSNKIIFFIEDITFISKLIDGSFPDYKRVIPKDNTNVLKINREILLSAVDRVSTIANEKSPVIKFKLLQNILNLNTINNESSTASEDLNINYNGAEIEIGFNSKYIMDIVNNLEDEEIDINFKNNTSPITAFENSNENLVYVLMPMRV